jgi:TorA maturation chaperone TorD
VVQHQHQISDEEVAQIRGIAEGRSKIYWFLSEFFLNAPTAGGLKALKAQLAVRPRDPEDETEVILEQLEHIVNTAPNLKQLAQSLAVEYTRLFSGIKDASGLPPPYESVHRESRLIGETTKAVIDAYRDAGFGEIDENAGPQDHIGVELKFLSLLCYEESRAWADNNVAAAGASCARQLDFLNKHALAWIPDFCNALAHAAGEDYYQLAGRLTRHVVENDSQNLQAIKTQYGLH